MDDLKCLKVDRRRGKLVIHVDLRPLCLEPELLPALIDRMKQECEVRLQIESTCFSTHREWMSQRIKRGIRRAKEGRAMGQ